MKKFLIKGLIFTVPFICYFLIIVMLDPFNYFGISSLINKNIKRKYSSKLNYAVWKVLRYKENPRENIFLGDSRMDGINARNIKDKLGLDFYDFAYGGGTLQEIIETFWFASSKIRLKNVCIGVNFNLYNAFNVRDRVKGAIDIVHNPLLYFSNKNTIEAAFYCLKSMLSSSNASIERPNLDKKEFWKFILSDAGTRFYAKYHYPQSYYEQLKKIAEYCRRRKIKLIFFILPVHVDLQNLIAKYGLENQYKKFIQDLRSFNDVYDFNFENKLTINQDNFRDPFHLDKSILTDLVIGVYKKHYDNSTLVRYSKF